MNLSILYRGPLSSCNYGCTYCPFAKTKNNRAELADDARKLRRFVDWIRAQSQHSFGILFTPWGEAAIRAYYQQAIAELSHLPQVRKVAIQTNLSFSTHWLASCNRATVALWATYHPTQTSRKAFVRKCRDLDDLGIQYSVGVVGFKEAFDDITALRKELSPEVYLWINAYKREANYYQSEDMEALSQIDRLFHYNTQHHPSLGRACRTGESVFSVDGDGTMYRCHFNKTPIGNIYEPTFEQNLFPRLCANQTCGCHIGYVHLNELPLYQAFGEGLLERIAKPVGME
jgi:MoaA/NifB/PqqE/SkfB family radical SAM enzyme